jgi:hypothetical protein
VNAASLALDEVWRVEGSVGGKGVYPQQRMVHLMDVIGAALCRQVTILYTTYTQICILTRILLPVLMLSVAKSAIAYTMSGSCDAACRVRRVQERLGCAEAQLLLSHSNL